MLQFLTANSKKYTLAEQAKMVLEGGCRWIELHAVKDVEEALPVVELCKGSEAFLTLRDDWGMARELGIHGVHLTKEMSLENLFGLREDLGPEAIIGLTVHSPEQVIALKKMDIDYCTLPSDMSLGEVEDFVKKVREAGVMIPIVYSGDITLELAPQILKTGVNGAITSKPILSAKDPVKYTSELLTALQS